MMLGFQWCCAKAQVKCLHVVFSVRWVGLESERSACNHISLRSAKWNCPVVGRVIASLNERRFKKWRNTKGFSETSRPFECASFGAG